MNPSDELAANPIDPEILAKVRALFGSQHDPRRLSTAVLVSLIAHALLLSIAIGGKTFGLPGLTFPWKDRRSEASDLHVTLAPLQRAVPPAATALPAAPSAGTVNDTSIALPMSLPAPVPVPVPAPAPAPASGPASVPPHSATAAPPAPATTERMRPDVNLPIAPNAPPVRASSIVATPSAPATANEAPMPSKVAQDQALEQIRLDRERQTAERLREAELTAEAQRQAARQELARQDAARVAAERDELARQDAVRREALQNERARLDEKNQQEMARQEHDRAEAARQEQAKQAQLEASRQETARREAAKQEAARREAERQDAMKQESARQDTIRQEAARQQAARQEAARQDALKQEAARQDALKQEAARQDAAKQEAARQAQPSAEQLQREQAQRERAEQEARREERLRAIGKQLAEEAAQRDAANNPSRSLLPGISSLRRGWLLGRVDPNADLVLYGEAMSRKIEMNMTFDMVRDVVKQKHTRPVVTMAIRADGSVEKVTFVTSSGVPAIDEAIRKVIASQAPYPAFPPALARQYDVIEIRRTWIFDMAIRLQ